MGAFASESLGGYGVAKGGRRALPQAARAGRAALALAGGGGVGLHRGAARGDWLEKKTRFKTKRGRPPYLAAGAHASLIAYDPLRVT